MVYSSFHKDGHGCAHLDIHMHDHIYHARVCTYKHTCSDSCLALRYSISLYLIRKRDQSLRSSLHSLLSEQRGEAIALG